MAWFIGNRSKDEAVNKARKEKGTLLASGMLAGGAIMGVVSAIMKYAGADVAMPTDYIGSSTYNILAIVMYAAICVYLVVHSMSKKTEN